MAQHLTHLISTKPNTVVWFWELYPEKQQEINTWIAQQPGFVSYSREMLNGQHHQYITFDSLENTLAYYSLVAHHELVQQRRYYNNTHGITTVSSRTEI